MNKQENALTIENLAILGCLDDVLDLYYHLCDVIENAYSEEKAAHPHSTIFPDKFDKLCKKTLNMFFETHANIFSEYHRLYINDRSFAGFSMLTCKKTAPLTLSYSIISFPKFLVQLQAVATRAVYHRVRKENLNAGYNQISASVSAHIFESVETENTKRKLNLSPLSNFSELIENAAPVWVYGNVGCITCVKDNHNIQNRTLCVPLLSEKYFVNLPVRYCLNCKRYFVSDQTLAAFEHKYGKMLLRTFQEFDSKDDFSKFASESELHSWGYNVIEGQMSESTRRQIITTLLNNNLMKKECICRDLENAIRIFKFNPRMRLAIQKWESDLVFTQELFCTPAVGIGILKQK